MNNHCPIYESTFLSKVLGFLEDLSISGRYRWVPNRGAVGKKGNDKRVIQSEKDIRRRMLIEVTVDDSNSLMSLEQKNCMWGDHDKLEVIIIPRYLKELTCSSWEPFKKRGGREVRKQGDLRETIMYFVYWSWWLDDEG